MKTPSYPPLGDDKVIGNRKQVIGEYTCQSWFLAMEYSQAN